MEPTRRRVPEPLYPTFLRDEIAGRVDRVRASMSDRGIDVLFLTARENVVYFSGLSSCAWIQKGVVPVVLLIPATGADTTMILPDFWLGTAEKTSWVDDYVLHRNSHSQPDTFASLLVDVMQQRGWGNARIGYEAGLEMLLGLPLREYEAVRRGLDRATWVDAGPDIWSARTIKSPAEIDRLRRSALAVNAAQERLREYARPGLSELELGWFLRKELLQPDGSEQDRLFLNMRAGTERYSMTDTYPKNRVTQEGDMLICDAGMFLEGYASDTARCMSLGVPRDMFESVYRSVVEAERAAVSVVKDGTPASAVYHAVRQVYDSVGFPVHVDMVGHGIGLDVHEPPMLSPGNDEPLRANMVINIEPWVTLPNDQGVLTIEDTFVVTSDGCEQLTLKNAEQLWQTATS